MTRRRRDPGEGDPGPYPGTRYSASGGLVGEGEAKFFGVVPKVQIGRTPELAGGAL